jgi:hypothetical protein
MDLVSTMIPKNIIYFFKGLWIIVFTLFVDHLDTFIGVCVVKRKLSLFSHRPQSGEDRDEENKSTYNKGREKVLPLYMHSKAP